MTLNEAIAAANNGDISSMESLMRYYQKNENTNNKLEWYDWGRKALYAGSVLAAKDMMLYAYLTGNDYKTRLKKHDLSKVFFADAGQAALTILANHDNETEKKIAKLILDHSLYNQALIIFEESDDDADLQRAYQLVNMADFNELKPYLLEAYINHPCHRNAEQLQELIQRLLSLKASDFTRTDIQADSPLKEIYSFDEMDIRMTSILYYKTADALCENFHQFDLARKLLEYAGQIIPDEDYARMITSSTDDLIRKYS